MKYQFIRPKKCRLIFVLILFLNTINGSISQGMDLDLNEDEEVHTTAFNQLKPNKPQDDLSKSSNSEEFNNLFNERTNLILPDSSKEEAFHQPHTPLNKTNLMEDELIELNSQSDEEIELTNRNSSLSHAYLLAFKDDPEKTNSKFLAFKYITSLVAGIGPIIPQIAIALRVGEYYESPALGYCLIGATVVSIEGITAWLMCELIDEAHKLVKTARQYQINSSACNIQTIKEVGMGVLSLVLGALSSAPDVYKTYKYNSIKEFAIISFIYDTIPRTIGFYKVFSSLNSMKFNTKNICKGENILKKQGEAFIDLSKAHFLNQCRKKGTTVVCDNLKNFTSSNEIYSYLSSGFPQDLMEETSYSYAKGIPRATVEYLALICPIASATFNVVLAYRGYGLFLDNPVAISLLSGFSVLPTFVLSSYVIKRAAGNLFDKLYLCKSDIPLSDYFSVFHIKTNAAFISTSFLIGAATSVSGFYLIADNMKDTFLNPVKYVFAALAVGTDLTFGSYTIYSTFTNFGEVIISQCNKGTSYALNCLKKLDEIRESIIDLSSDIIANFMDDINPHSEALY